MLKQQGFIHIQPTELVNCQLGKSATKDWVNWYQKLIDRM